MVDFLVANAILDGIVVNCFENLKEIKRQYWNFIRITFAISVHRET